ncbi:MAG: SUMF1/EgtB/PvdO family nonheme iron enzyme [Bacteroidetes bacterium]|nr:SUMF1/EgtB/PvdO family nonheme iron enzyme [Bacteroidota bacterium]
MKFPIFLIVFLIQLKSFAQDVSSAYHIRYYYQLQKYDPNLDYSVKPDAKTIKILTKNQDIFIDSVSFLTESQSGYDSIWNANKYFHTNPFFIHALEISNAEYAEFLKTHTAPAYYPDTLVWLKEGIDDHPYVHYYFQHKAYRTYPVVGINHWQAIQFCKWKTEEILKLLKKNGIQNYKVEVSLPQEYEFQAVYTSLYPKWVLAFNKAGMGPVIPNSTAFVLGAAGYRANFGEMPSFRLQNLRVPYTYYETDKGVITPVKSYPSVYGIYNLLGNVSEWTETAARNTLFNTQEYMYTYTGNLVPNPMPVDPEMLNKSLHDTTQMEHFYAIKGGSWNQEFFYLQPAATIFKNEMYRSNNVGFRYVIRFYKN